MPVDFYIPRINGKPQYFENMVENLAMQDIAAKLWQCFHDAEDQFMVGPSLLETTKND